MQLKLKLQSSNVLVETFPIHLLFLRSIIISEMSVSQCCPLVTAVYIATAASEAHEDALFQTGSQII